MSNITQEEFDAYEGVRQSGVTNMFAVNTVSDYSGLSKDKLVSIMKIMVRCMINTETKYKVVG